jgi:hypothetical protein
MHRIRTRPPQYEERSLHLFRDPAGHRVEILLAPPQVTDIEQAPQGWDEANRYGWSPPPRSWTRPRLSQAFPSSHPK